MKHGGGSDHVKSCLLGLLLILFHTSSLFFLLWTSLNDGRPSDVPYGIFFWNQKITNILIPLFRLVCFLTNYEYYMGTGVFTLRSCDTQVTCVVCLRLTDSGSSWDAFMLMSLLPGRTHYMWASSRSPFSVSSLHSHVTLHTLCVSQRAEGVSQAGSYERVSPNRRHSQTKTEPLKLILTDHDITAPAPRCCWIRLSGSKCWLHSHGVLSWHHFSPHFSPGP